MTEVELQLVALGRELVVPETPDLVPAVLARIAPRRRRWRRQRWLLAVALALVAALGATLAIPSARSAFLRILHIGGERVEIVEKLPPLRPGPSLYLGERVSLSEARRRVPFPIVTPKRRPDAVYVDSFASGDEINLLYGTLQHVRVIISERAGQVPPWVAKKIARPATMTFVDVGGAQGLFVSGTHYYMVLNRRGQPEQEAIRLSRSALIWSRGRVAYRIEGDLTREQALELAASLRLR